MEPTAASDPSPPSWEAFPGSSSTVGWSLPQWLAETFLEPAPQSGKGASFSPILYSPPFLSKLVKVLHHKLKVLSAYSLSPFISHRCYPTTYLTSIFLASSWLLLPWGLRLAEHPILALWVYYLLTTLWIYFTYSYNVQYSSQNAF